MQHEDVAPALDDVIRLAFAVPGTAPARVLGTYDAAVMKQALDYLQPRCREVLRLRYMERCDGDTIAARLETSTRYAEKLVENCRQRLFEIAHSIQRTR